MGGQSNDAYFSVSDNFYGASVSFGGGMEFATAPANERAAAEKLSKKGTFQNMHHPQINGSR